MGEPEALISTFEAAILDFERAYMRLADKIAAEGGDRQPLREIYARLHIGIERLKASKDYLGGRLGLKHGVPIAVKGAALEGKYGTKRKTWEHERLKAVVSEKIIASHIDPESGSLTAPPGVLMLEMLDAVSINAWKVTTLRKLGFSKEDISRYCDETPGKFNIRVHRAGESPLPKDDDEDSD